MPKKIFTLIFLQSLTIFLFAQTKSFFPDLTLKKINTSLNTFISYDKAYTRFYNTPCHLLKKTDPAYSTDMEETGGVLVARYKNPGLKDSISILFEAGPSDDPKFMVYDKDQKKLMEVFCLSFYINASGIIYTEGHTNNMYNAKRKFQIRGQAIIEIKQPFNYVGLKGNTKKPIVLYQQMEGNEEVARIPINSPIEILLAPTADNDKLDKLFLVKSSFGLVGWLRISEDEIFGAIIEGLIFAGD